jgi:hypothetical protein
MLRENMRCLPILGSQQRRATQEGIDAFRPDRWLRIRHGAKLLVAAAEARSSATLLAPGSVEQVATREFKFPMHVDGQVRSLFFHIVPHDRA